MYMRNWTGIGVAGIKMEEREDLNPCGVRVRASLQILPNYPYLIIHPKICYSTNNKVDIIASFVGGHCLLVTANVGSSCS